MQALLALTRPGPVPIGPMLLVASLLLGTSVAQEPTWQAEAYRDFSAEHRAATRDGGETRLVEPGLKLIRTTVQRPRLRPGDAASLKAEYLIGASGGGTMVRETRVITFNGATVATLERDVRRSTGSAGSELQLRVPRDAAEGWYTLTTTIRRVTSTPDTAQVEGSTGFYIDASSDPPPAASQAKPPQTQLRPARPPPQPEEEPRIRLVADKARYRIGDRVVLRVEASRDGFLTLINVGTSGKLTVLFPNRFSPSHGVKAGKIYAIPEAKDNYDLVLEGPAGSELVYALFTVKPVKFVETDFSGTTQIFPSITQGAPSLTRDINVVVKRTPVREQTRKVLELEVVE